MVRKVSEQPSADRPHHEAYGKQNRGVQLLDDRIAARKERIREIQREGGVRIEVVPFDKIADRPDKDRLQAPANGCETGLFDAYRDFPHCGDSMTDFGKWVGLHSPPFSRRGG